MVRYFGASEQAPRVTGLTPVSHLRFVPTRTEALGLDLVYIPLSDVLAHLAPASTLSEVQALCR